MDQHHGRLKAAGGGRWGVMMIRRSKLQWELSNKGFALQALFTPNACSEWGVGRLFSGSAS